MLLAAQYAKALKSLTGEHSRSAEKILGGLREALKRRGHLSLLPRIFAEYEKLELREARVPKDSPERTRTRTLLQLYRHLTRE